MFSIQERVMESESMETLDEVYAYDKLTMKYLAILHNGFIETVINSAPPKGKFLEVGCGTGRISIGIAKYTDNIALTGIDLSEHMLNVARDNARYEKVDQKVNFQLGDAKSIPFEDDTFDAVFSHNMLHHIPDPVNVVLEMERVVKNGGAILIRDLKRISSILIPMHVHILGLPYNQLMKKEYRDSIRAAFSEDEWEVMFRKSNILDAFITKQFITHQGIERVAKKRRKEYISIPTPIYLRPFKNYYVSASSNKDSIKR